MSTDWSSKIWKLVGVSQLYVFWSLRYLIRYLLVTQFSPERQKLMWSFAKKCSNAVYFSQLCLLFLLRKGNPDPELQNSRVYVCSSIYWQQNSGNIAKKIPYYPHRLTPDFCLLCYRIHSRFEFHFFQSNIFLSVPGLFWYYYYLLQTSSWKLEDLVQ